VTESIEKPPVIRHADGSVHLSDGLIAHMAHEARRLAVLERTIGRPLNVEQFAAKIIRATVNAINSNNEDPRMAEWLMEKRAIACLDDEQAEQSFARWKGYSYAA